nr:uncharacterized protein LOC115268564 [Aedes albopictus]
MRRRCTRGSLLDIADSDGRAMSQAAEDLADEVSAGAYVCLAGHEGGDMAEGSGSSAGAFVSSAGYDIGAAGSATGSSKAKISKKRLMKELKEAVEKNNALREQVTRLSMDQNMGSALHHACSSGQETCASRTESLLLSTMSSWTLGTLNVPECVPAQGESEVDKRSYEYWKETLMASLQLVNSANEHAKYGVFKIKAGVKLREIFNTTVSSPTMPDERTHPFSNALARLDDYFGSRTYLLSQRGKLMNLCQSPTERSVDFVRRVASTAKLCSYGENEEMEAVVRVITTGANDSRVRVLARRNWIKQGSMKDLIDLIIDHEIERANEEEFQKTRQRNESGTIAAVSRGPQELQLQRQANFHGNWRGRGNTAR